MNLCSYFLSPLSLSSHATMPFPQKQNGRYEEEQDKVSNHCDHGNFVISFVELEASYLAPLCILTLDSWNSAPIATKRSADLTKGQKHCYAILLNVSITLK